MKSHKTDLAGQKGCPRRQSPCEKPGAVKEAVSGSQSLQEEEDGQAEDRLAGVTHARKETEQNYGRAREESGDK